MIWLLTATCSVTRPVSWAAEGKDNENSGHIKEIQSHCYVVRLVFVCRGCLTFSSTTTISVNIQKKRRLKSNNYIKDILFNLLTGLQPTRKSWYKEEFSFLVLIHSFLFTPTGNLESPINVTCMRLDCGRRLEYPERTHADTMRTWKCPGPAGNRTQDLLDVRQQC